MADANVRVALRARPLIPEEESKGCLTSLSFVPNEPQVVLGCPGQDKAFSFDYVFDTDSTQEQLYSTAVADRINYLFEGYNVTVLAYGQTGSGKTHTMGTTSSSNREDVLDASCGVIQRVIHDIFAGIERKSSKFEFTLKVSFLEVYKEDVYDLLQKNNTPVVIREDLDGIKIVGLTELPVTSASDTYRSLEQGSLLRTTASTAMNSRSSRSHAIFSIIMEQRSVKNSLDIKRSKLHLVDLAGSERASKTQAVGERFKEGVKINRGLLALGNVISALCDEASHTPYRDSKLTRLLQDSLGGNSHTIFIACVSPADVNLEETLNTLRYADRARKIKNKPIVNIDPKNLELMRLKQQVQELQLQLMQKQSKDLFKEPAPISITKSYKLTEKVRPLTSENPALTVKPVEELQLVAAKGSLPLYLKELHEKVSDMLNSLIDTVEDQPEVLKKLQELQELQNQIVEIQSGNGLSDSSDSSDMDCEMGEDLDIQSTLKRAAMSRELEQLEDDLAQKEQMASQMTESNVEMAAMRVQFEINLREMEVEIVNLQKEKEDLSNALKAAQSSNLVSKVSEQRRKRLRDLESQIADMKKQMSEKTRLLKSRQEAERKVNVLQQEIQSMKSTRIKLMRQIKEENERYRMLKVEKDREVAQLKQKDRKRQYEMTKLQNDFSKQKTVLKRKMEEAAAANKRLNEALMQQRGVAERRMKEKKTTYQGMGERIQQWLSQEMDMLLTSKEAKHYLQVLLEDRETIEGQMNILKNLEHSEPPSKRRSVDGFSSEPASLTETNKQIELLENELVFRNKQITELQQQIHDADQVEKTKTRWETLTSVEAKCALKYLFDTAVGVKYDLFLEGSKASTKIECLEADILKMQKLIKSSTAAQCKLTDRMQNLKMEHKNEVDKLVAKHHEQTHILLKQVRNLEEESGGSSDLKEEVKDIQLSNMNYLHQALQQKEREIVELKEQFEVIRRKGQKPRLMLHPLTPKLNKTITIADDGKSNKSAMAEFLMNSFSEDENQDIDEYQDKDDPDWRLTPHLKRNRSTRQNSDSTGCSCKAGCSTRRCSCNKQLKHCSPSCKCMPQCCLNQDERKNMSDSDEGPLFQSSQKNGTNEFRRALSELSECNTSDDFVYVRSPSKRGKRAME